MATSKGRGIVIIYSLFVVNAFVFRNFQDILSKKQKERFVKYNENDVNVINP